LAPTFNGPIAEGIFILRLVFGPLSKYNTICPYFEPDGSIPHLSILFVQDPF